MKLRLLGLLVLVCGFGIFILGCPGKNPVAPTPVANTSTFTPTETALCSPFYTFGKSAQGAATMTLSANTYYMTQYSLPAPANVYRLHAFLPNASSGTHLRMALYSNSSGAPQTLEGQTASQSAGPGWNTLDVPATLLPAGTYWISLVSDGSLPLAYDAGSVNDEQDGSLTYGAFPANLTAPVHHLSVDLTLSADYCVGPGTLTPLPTNTFTTTQTPTITPTNISASCFGSYSFGRNLTPSGAVSWGLNDGTEFTKVTLTASGIVSALHAYILNANGDSFTMALYTNSGSAPGTLISSSSSQAAVNGWNSVTIPPTTMLAPGTYWIAAGTNSSSALYFALDDASVGADASDGYVQGFSVIPATFSGTGPNQQSYYFYADYCVPGTSPTPVKSPTLTLTPTRTVTPTFTTTPTLGCSTLYGFGRNFTPSGSVSLGLNSGTEFSKFNLPVSGQVSVLHAYILNANGNSFSMGLYSDTGSGPGTLIASTGSQAAVNGWNNFSMSGTSLLPSGNYWIAAGTNDPGNALYFALNDSSDGADASDGYVQGFTILPSTFSGSGPNQQSFYFYGEYCVPGTSPTPGKSPTLTMTLTRTVTPTFTPTQTLGCSSTYSFGRNYTPSGAVSWGLNSGTEFSKFTLTTGGVVSTLHAYLIAANGNSFSMGIYSNSGSAPGTLISGSGSQAAVNGWNSFNISATPLLAAGTYWIAAGTNAPGNALYFAIDDASVGADASDGYVQGFTILPATFSGSGPNQQSYYFYADYCVYGSSPTPGKSPTQTTTYTYTATPSFTPTQTQPCASPSIFGYNTTLGSSSTFGGGYFIFTRFALASGPETLTTLQAYVASNNQDMRMAIYNDLSGAPHTLLTQSNPQAVTVGWNTFPVPQVPLSAPATYWIGSVTDNYGSGTGLSYKTESPNPANGYEAGYSYGPFPSTFPGGGGSWDYTIAYGARICP